MQAQADLLQVPVEVYPSAHATPLGAAACARLALEPGADRGRRRRRLDARRDLRAGLVGATGPRTHLDRWHAGAAVRPQASRDRVIAAGHRRSTSPSSAPASSAPRSPASSPARPPSVALVEARADVGDGTSKANTAILHTGFDATPGTLESRLVRRGYELLGAYAAAHRHPGRAHRRAARRVDRRGARRRCPALRDKAEANGYQACELVDADEVYRRGAAPRPGRARRARPCPDESIICTWTTTLALATDAVAGAPSCCCGHRVTGVASAPTVTRCWRPTAATSRARWVVNAAGLGADRRRPAVRPRPLHRHPAPRRAARLRQARPAAGAARSCCRCRRRAARASWSAPPSTAT